MPHYVDLRSEEKNPASNNDTQHECSPLSHLSLSGYKMHSVHLFMVTSLSRKLSGGAGGGSGTSMLSRHVSWDATAMLFTADTTCAACGLWQDTAIQHANVLAHHGRVRNDRMLLRLQSANEAASSACLDPNRGLLLRDGRTPWILLTTGHAKRQTKQQAHAHPAASLEFGSRLSAAPRGQLKAVVPILCGSSTGVGSPPHGGRMRGSSDH